MLTDKSNKLVFIHCAADIQFDRPLNTAMQINVMGTYSCLKLAQHCNAIGFLHVSTLYVNSRLESNSVIKEELCDLCVDGVAVFEEWQKCNEEFNPQRIVELTSGKDKMAWPNTYTLTKNIGEQVLVDHCRQIEMPLCITRLGIVSPCYRENSGWFLGNGGFVFVGIGAATGHLRYFNGDGNGRPDLVPVDFTVNGILGACAEMIFDNSTKKCRIYQLGIANKEADDWSWHTLFAYTAPRFRAENFPDTAPGYVHFIPNKYLFAGVEWIILDIPLLVARPFECLLSWFLFRTGGEQPKLSRKITFLRKAREKMRWLNNNYTYFMNGRWKFDHTNVMTLFDSLDKESKQEYDFDVHGISLDKYACETIILVMKKWQAHKALKAQQEKEMRKNMLQMEKKKEVSRQRMIEVVKRLGVSLGGIGQTDVGYPWLVSLIVTILLLWIFFVVFG